MNKEIIISEININPDWKYFFKYNDNGNDDFGTNNLYRLRQLHGLNRDNEILYCYKYENFIEGDFFTASRNYVSSSLLLEDRICLRYIVETTGWDKGSDFISDIYWYEIEKTEGVYYTNSDNSKSFFVRFFLKNGNQYIDAPTYLFGVVNGSDEETMNYMSDAFNRIIARIREAENELASTFIGSFQEIYDAFNEEQYQKCLDLIKKYVDYEFLKAHEKIHFHDVLFVNSFSLRELGNNKAALKLLNQKMTDLEYYDELRFCLARIYRLRGKINEELEYFSMALEDCQVALSYSDDTELTDLLNERLEFTYSKIVENFWNLKYDERKVLMISNEIRSSFSSDLIVLDKTYLPEKITFPLSHPKTNEIYIGHPFVKESYIPFSTYETELFNDRFEEFSYFIQCLGAKSMTIKVIKGTQNDNSNNSTHNVDANIGVGKSIIKNNLDVSFENNTNSNKQNSLETTRIRTQKYNPVKKPYIPENLLWYPNEPTWQRLYQQRIGGKILNHHDFMSSKNSYSINEIEKTNLKAAFKNVLVDAKLEIDSLIEHTFNQNESIEWEIDIEFEPLENLEDVTIESDITYNISKNSSVEEEYIEEVKFFLGFDGVIDDKERAILERFRIKNGISPEKAFELERKATLDRNFNEDELEYLNEFREILSDGVISEKERKILTRFATRLNISNERAFELEQSVLLQQN